jgi:formate hydrogenlyase subunit 3/multisubunit Na+/H+ antiporter MnhD subunit
MWIGTVTMAVGVMYAMVQTDLKRMLAFSTVSQIGYMMMGLGIGTPLAIAAGLLHCLNHGFFKGGLFLTAGSVQHAAGTRDMNQLGGLAQKMPQTTLSWLIGIGSMMGIPLMSGFASKWMLYAAALQAGWAVPAVVAWAVSLGTVFLGVKATSAVFLGPLTKATKDAHESPPTMVWGMGFLAAGTIVLGIAPQLAVNYMLNPILGVFQLATVQVTWFGLSGNAGSFSTMGGLVLAVVSLVVGGVIYALAYASRPAAVVVSAGGGGAALVAGGGGGGIFTGGEPLSDEGRMTASDFSHIFLDSWHEFFRWTKVDAVYLGFWSGMQAVSRALGAVVSWMERYALLLIVVLSAALVATVHNFAPAFSGGAEGAAGGVSPLLTAACAVAAVALVLAALAHSRWRRLAPLMLLASAASVAGLLMADPWQRLGLLELGALLTIPLVWQSAKTGSIKLLYLLVVVISAGSLVASDLLMGQGQPDWARALLITSVCVKLAAIPLFFWLLKLADEVPALVLGIIIAVVDMAAFGELCITAQASPASFAPQGWWLGAAAATSFTAALLMLTQRSLKRLLVLSTVEDIGFLLLGVASLSALGTTGALIAASTHALAKALLFACLSGPEADGALDRKQTGLAANYPVAAFGFLFGMLAMLGIPPTLGFIGRWRLYELALQINPFLVAIFILSSIMALIAYVLALTGIWWGPAYDPALQHHPDAAHPAPAPVKEPFLLQATIVVLTILLVAAGSWPSVLQLLLGGRP